MKIFNRTILIILLYIISYIPIIILIGLAFFAKNSEINNFTLIITIISFLIRDFGLDLASSLAIENLKELNILNDEMDDDFKNN